MITDINKGVFIRIYLYDMQSEYFSICIRCLVLWRTKICIYECNFPLKLTSVFFIYFHVLKKCGLTVTLAKMTRVCVCVGSVCTANLDKAIIGNNKCYMVFAGIRAKKRGYGAA